MSAPGTLAGIGVGPGDPELMTLKGLRLLKGAAVVAYPCKSADGGVAKRTVEDFLTPEQTLLPMVYPLTADGADRADYEVRLARFYDETAEALAAHLVAGRDVAVLCEGDPFLYGSFMYWHARLKDRFPVVTVPGVSSVVAGPVSAARPLTVRDDALAVLPGTLSEDDLAVRLRGADAAVILKLGRTWPKVRRALDRAGVLDRALYVERASHASESVMPAAELDVARPPYFSMVVGPSARPVDVAQPETNAAPPKGAPTLTVLGLGPGAADWLTPQ
ncbi:MAG: precorrin-2 C(20)-methyltransferase, partial [Pseudomonadota bacterium]